jgi:hypothetical protein
MGPEREAIYLTTGTCGTLTLNMSLKKAQIVSALVVMRPASGKPLGRAVITAETLGQFVPSVDAVARVKQAMTDRGFEVGDLVGISFSITAPVRTFETVFRARLRREPRGGIEVVQADGSGSYQLPLQELPQTIAENVESVTFTPPPDFGPSEFGC